jgi:hypothetical protein
VKVIIIPFALFCQLRNELNGEEEDVLPGRAAGDEDAR